MGECLKTLQNFVLTKKQEITTEQNNKKEEE